MNQQPDKLFRDKLEGFHKPVPTAAWNKIEAGLQKKNNKTIWLKVAAAVLLVAVAAFLVWTNQRTPAEQLATDTIQNNKKENQGQDQKHDQTEAKEESIVQPEQMPPPIATTIGKKASRTKSIQSPPVKSVEEEPIVIEEPVIEELVSFTPPANTTDSSVVETTNTMEETIIVASSTEEEQDQSRVLVLSVEEVNAKYLDKEALAKATSAQKKSSTFRKLLNKAYDLKYNQDPFGELRQKKNEILALNFKSEKRSQNK
jgi:ABC-type nickel/cobalt efflux system permease component RcnA